MNLKCHDQFNWACQLSCKVQNNVQKKGLYTQKNEPKKLHYLHTTDIKLN